MSMKITHRLHIIGEATPTLLNREGQFVPTGDWIQVLRIGEFLGRSLDGKQFSQVIDEKALDAIVTAFNREKTASNFPGLLIDRDHLSHYSDKETRAAGWVMNIEKREDGLWAMPKWTSEGAAEISNGIYRMVSPVLTNGEEVGQTADGIARVRPGRFIRLALTNDPNIKGMQPLANRRSDETDHSMDYKSLLLNMLGLADNADDASVTTAVANAKAKMASPGKDEETCNRLRGEIEVLTNRVNAAEKLVIEADVVKYKGLGLKDEDLRAQLVANRAGTVKILDAIIANKKAGKDADEDGRQIHKANERRAPVTKAKTDAERAQLIAAEVSTYQIANKASFADAYDHIARHKPELFQLASAE
jgi:phage I-like protein